LAQAILAQAALAADAAGPQVDACSEPHHCQR